MNNEGQSLTVHEVDNDGVKLALSVIGDGPDLLFVHGLGSAQVLWQPFISTLRHRYRCWNLDLRGHGESARAPGAYDGVRYGSDVAAALDHIGRPTIGVGHSLGGSSLARVATAQHPDIAAIYIVDSALLPRDGVPNSVGGIFAKQLAMLRAFQPENRPVDDYEAVLAAAPYVAGGTNADHMLPEQLRGRAESLSQLDPECIEAALDGRHHADRVAPAFAIPARIVGADPELGASIRPEMHDRLRELTPHLEIRELEGVAHQTVMIRGYDEIILDDLETWLARVNS
jgi:pimeloyl-ACP methyl ester carboxylesterase